MQYRKTADDAVPHMNDDLLLRIVPNGVDVILEFLGKSRFKDVRSPLHMHIVDLLAQFIHPAQFILFCKAYRHVSFSFLRSA